MLNKRGLKTERISRDKGKVFIIMSQFNKMTIIININAHISNSRSSIYMKAKLRESKRGIGKSEIIIGDFLISYI